MHKVENASETRNRNLSVFEINVDNHHRRRQQPTIACQNT